MTRSLSSSGINTNSQQRCYPLPPPGAPSQNFYCGLKPDVFVGHEISVNFFQIEPKCLIENGQIIYFLHLSGQDNFPYKIWHQKFVFNGKKTSPPPAPAPLSSFKSEMIMPLMFFYTYSMNILKRRHIKCKCIAIHLNLLHAMSVL